MHDRHQSQRAATAVRTRWLNVAQMVDDQVAPEELDKFEQFLFQMDDSVDRFVSDAAAAGHPLDFSIESLPKLESYLIQRLPTEDEDENQTILNRAARYFGELFRHNLGGKWELCLKDPQYLYYMLPVISGYSDRPIEFCPIAVLANFKLKLSPGMLKTAYDSHAEFAR